VLKAAIATGRRCEAYCVAKSTIGGLQPTPHPALRALRISRCSALLRNSRLRILRGHPYRRAPRWTDHRQSWCTIVKRFSRDTGPVLLLERLIDKSTANCERLFYCVVNTLLAALMRVLIVKVVIDYHLVARHFGFTSLCVDHQSRRADNAGSASRPIAPILLRRSESPARAMRRLVQWRNSNGGFYSAHPSRENSPAGFLKARLLDRNAV
jgi:hypothetical protein